MHGLTEEKRHSPVGAKQKNYQTAVFFLMLPPFPHCNISTASIGNTGLSLGSRELGGLEVCCLIRAQAAICHPTLASLILILSPAWPSRPAVSSPQKGFLLGVWSGGS